MSFVRLSDFVYPGISEYYVVDAITTDFFSEGFLTNGASFSLFYREYPFLLQRRSPSGEECQMVDN